MSLFCLKRLVEKDGIKRKGFELCSYSDEQEWFEFKENWFQADGLGEHVSALSNLVAFHNKT